MHHPSPAATPGGDDDAWLITQISHGDVGALSALYDRHAPAIYGLARALLGEGAAADTATKNAFLALWYRNADRRGDVLPVRRWLAMSVCNEVLEPPGSEPGGARPALV